jgi:hypothetical protein
LRTIAEEPEFTPSKTVPRSNLAPDDIFIHQTGTIKLPLYSTTNLRKSLNEQIIASRVINPKRRMRASSPGHFTFKETPLRIEYDVQWAPETARELFRKENAISLPGI